MLSLAAASIKSSRFGLVRAARYLVLADIDKCLVLVLSVEQGVEGGAIVFSVAMFATT